MSYTLISTYSKTLKRGDIIIDNKNYHYFSFLHNIKVLLHKKNQYVDQTLYLKILPLNRFFWVQKLNKKLLDFFLNNLMKNTNAYIYWFRNPEYYYLHNVTNFNYLVFDCEKTLLLEENRYIRYKECFLKKWIFVYHFNNVCETHVFKKRTEKGVLQMLIKDKFQ